MLEQYPSNFLEEFSNFIDGCTPEKIAKIYKLYCQLNNYSEHVDYIYVTKEGFTFCAAVKDMDHYVDGIQAVR